MLYLPSKEVLERWRERSKPYKLSHWVVLMVEKGLEDKPDTTETTDTINDLRNKNQKLFEQGLKLSQENKILTARLRAKDTAFHNLDMSVVNLFRYGGTKCFSPKEIQEAAGLCAQRLDPDFLQDRLKAVDFTLAQLEAVGFIKKHWQGWQWVL
jgi:hypothetical protein